MNKLKQAKSKLKEGAAALVGIEDGEDEESLLQKELDKAEGEVGKVAKRGNGFPKVLLSEPGRQAFWFLIIALSVISCQAGLAFSFVGATLRPALENHEVMLAHYGRQQATINVGKAGSFIVIVGLMMVKGSSCQLVAALLARQKRKSRRRLAVKLAFGCVLFEIVFIILMCVATGLFAVWLAAYHSAYRQTFPKAVVNGYLKNASITAYVNWVQYRFECCGVKDFKDWFIADWVPRQWLINRYPTVVYYRDKMYAVGPKVDRYPEWREMSRMANYEKSWASRIIYIQDRAKGLVDDDLIDEYVSVTSFAEVPFSCCRPDSVSTWCVRQYLLFKLYAYDFKVNSTIFRRGCPKQVETYITSRLLWVGIGMVVLILVRVLNLVMLRLVQTSTFNALVARRHLSPALGWLFTTQSVTPPTAADEKPLLDDDDDFVSDDGVSDVTSELTETDETDPSTGDGWTEPSGAETTDGGETETAVTDGETSEADPAGETTEDFTDVTTLPPPE